MCFTNNFWSLLIAGVATGFLYALIALGYTLVYGVLQLINFAHSEVFMGGAFGGLFFTTALIGKSGHATGMMSVVAVVGGTLAGAATGGAIAFVLERVAYRPLRRRKAPPLAFLISAIGASYFLIQIFGKEFGRQYIAIPQMFDPSGVMFTVFGQDIRTDRVVIATAAIVMLVLLDRLVNKTRLGQGIRAVAQDADTASLMGVNIDRVISQTFVVGGLLGGAAGFLYGIGPNVAYNMGFIPGLKAFTAAVLGGIGNIRGAMLGGVVLGVVESLSVACIDVAWRDVIAFLVLVLVLLFRPTGILGERLGRSA